MKMPWSKKQQATRQPRLMEGQNGYVFRRSRTLTGTTSPKVAASAEKRGLLKTQRLKLHELRLQRNQVLRGAAVIVVLIGIAVYLGSTFIASPHIGYAQAGVHEPNTPVYQQTIQQYLNERPLERFGLILNTEQLEAYLKSKHSELRSTVVQRAWYGGDTSFSFYFREPLLVWQTAGKQFYVDDQGVAFSYNHFAEPAVIVTDQSGISPETGGGAVASSRFIGFLGRMVGAVNGYAKGNVESVILPASTREIDLKLQGRAYLIKTHIDRDPIEQAEDIANALSYFDKAGIKPEYVDVRVAHKAFYK